MSRDVTGGSGADIRRRMYVFAALLILVFLIAMLLGFVL